MNCKSMLAAALAVALAGHHLPVTSAERHTHAASPAAVTDARQLIRLPEPMRVHTITSMRDHLSALQEINAALSMNDFDKAAGIAERRLGMSSLESHGAAHVAPYMPQSMRDIGTQMHRAASRFAVEAQNASVGDDVRPALGALSKVMEQCVACHAAYRLH